MYIILLFTEEFEKFLKNKSKVLNRKSNLFIMERIQEYDITSVFGNKRNLTKYLAGRKPTDRVLISSNNSLGYTAFYDRTRNKVILELKGDSLEKLTTAETEFFKWASEFFKKK